MASAQRLTDGRRWLAPDRGRLWDEAEVVGVVPDAPGVTTLRLTLPETPELLPGQYYLVRLAIERPPGMVEQAYSVSSPPYPQVPDLEITVREVPDGRASPLLVRHVRVGDRLQVRGPFGFLTWTEKDGGPLMLIGAGSGVAPFMSIVRYAVARRAQMPMTVLCSSRDRAAVLFRQPLEELTASPSWLSVTHTFTRSPHDPYARFHRRIDTRMLEELVSELEGADIAEMAFLVAGPAGMVSAAREAIMALGAPDANVYSEDHA